MGVKNIAQTELDFGIPLSGEDGHGYFQSEYGYYNGHWTPKSVENGVNSIEREINRKLNDGEPLSNLDSAICVMAILAQQRSTKQLPKNIKKGATNYFSTLNEHFAKTIERLANGEKINGEQAEILGAQIYCLFGVSKRLKPDNILDSLQNSDQSSQSKQLTVADVDKKLTKQLIQLGNQHERIQNSDPELFKQSYDELASRTNLFYTRISQSDSTPIETRNCLGFTLQNSDDFISLRNQFLNIKHAHFGKEDPSENPVKRILHNAANRTREKVLPFISREKEDPERQ